MLNLKETKPLPRIIPWNDIEKLLNYMHRAVKESKYSKSACRDLAVVELFFATGARVYEVSNLKSQDVDLDSGVIRIMGKGSKERYVQIGNPAVLKVLRKYYEQCQAQIEQCGLFFVNQRGTRFAEQSVRNMLRKYVRLAGIGTHITPHMFRHSVATYLLEEGVDIAYIQKILGHSSIKTTQIYLHIASKKQLEILRERHPRNKMKIVQAA